MTATLLLLATSAFALERSGSSEIEVDGRKIHHTFTSSYNPANHSLTRNGIVTLANGMTFTYELSGTCTPALERCDLYGRGRGPVGREWTGQGNVSRDSGKTIVKATLFGPANRTISIDREVQGDVFPDFDF